MEESTKDVSRYGPISPAYPIVAIALLCSAIYMSMAILVPNDSVGRTAIDYYWVAILGIAVGATELLSRYRDRPWAAVCSPAGLVYMAVNGAASCFALFLMFAWKVPSSDAATRVLTAGFSAMAFFRSGLLTTRVNDQDLPIGPNLVLKILLDVLDRAYDRERTFQRADLVRSVMGGVSYEKARTVLKQFSLNLMQNVSKEERDKFDTDIAAIEKETSDPETQALAFGLRLFDIVGDTTLAEASRVLGSSIVDFQWLDDDLLVDAGAPTYADLRANLYGVCNTLTHPRRRMSPRDMQAALAEIDAMGAVNERARGLLLVHSAKRQYGRETLKRALVLLAP